LEMWSKVAVGKQLQAAQWFLQLLLWFIWALKWIRRIMWQEGCTEILYSL